MLKVADLIRIEVHGPAEELEKLKGPLAHLNPAWFTLEAIMEHEVTRDPLFESQRNRFG